MKKNTWVFYFFIILFTALISVNLVWRFTPIKSEIQNYFVNHLKPIVGEEFLLENFSLGFGYISFNNITLGKPQNNFFLTVEEVQVGYSIHKLILNKMNPLSVIESITLINPQVIFSINRSDQSNQSKNDSLDISKIILNFKKMAEIDRILIKDGEIQWQKTVNSPKKLLSGLDGFLFTQSDSLASLHLIGKLFDSSSKTLNLNGNIYFEQKKWDMLITVDSCRLDKGLPFLNEESFFVDNALLQGFVKIGGPSFNILDLTTEGRINVSELTARLYDQRVTTNNFNITFSEQKMILDTLRGTVEEGEFVLTGNLGEIFRPGTYFDVEFQNYAVKDIAISAPILELLNQGELNGRLNLSGPVGKITITGSLFSPKLYYHIVPFLNAEINFNFKEGIWTFENITCYAVAMDHQGTGHINFNNMTMVLNVSSSKIFAPDVFPIIDRLNSSTMKYTTNMEGVFETLTFKGSVEGTFINQDQILTTFETSYVLIDDNITINSTTAYPENLKLYAEISTLWDDPTFDILEIKDIPLGSLSSIGVVQWISQKFQSDMFFSGPVNFPSVKINFSNRLSGEPFFSFAGSASNLIEENLKFTSSFIFETSPENIQGKLDLVNQSDNLNLTLNIPGIVFGNLAVGQGENAPISGSFAVEEVTINNFIGKIPTLYKAISDGNITGILVLTGSTSFPTVDFDFKANNFIINQNGYYTAQFSGTYQKNDFSFREAWVSQNNRPVLNCTFNLNPETNIVKANFSGDDIESNFLATTIFNNPALIRGKFKYDIHMEGDFNQPNVSGTIAMLEGEMEKRAFDEVYISFEDSIPEGTTLFQLNKHILKIKEFRYIDQKDYTIEGNGILATSESGPLDLHITCKGNILAELPSLLDYFKNPKCNGELFVHLGGSPDNPKISAGRLKIFDGSMEFESVVPPLTDLKADIELIEGEQFVHINSIEGNIIHHWCKIYNLESESIKRESFNPWLFEDLGLNFGILVMETDPLGIPLSIPGLMYPGDIGNFAVSGKEDGEKFYFTGPVNLPHVRGKVVLYDSRITFPFLLDEEEWDESEETVVLDFLMNIEWDVFCVSGKGNRYFVDIPAIIGQVYMDLDIDNVSKGLEFTGRLIDESFRTEGEVESTRGRVEYLDMTFRVEKFGAEFSRFELWPRVYGRAWTTVRDSTNFPKDIYLTLYAVDPETKQEVSRGRWDDFRFKLISSDPTITETQESVLAIMGYSVDNLSTKAGDVGLTLTENYLIRPLVRPLERKLERSLRLDYVRLRSNITSNLFYFGLQNRLTFLQNPLYYHQPLNNNFDPALLLLQSSEFTLGKYLLKDIYFTYSGQLVSVYDESKIGLNHRLNLEYRLLRNLLLEFEYDKFQFDPQFYSRESLSDFRIRLRHSFNF